MGNIRQDLNLTRSERRLFIINMRGHGYQLKEIAEALGSSTSQVSLDLKIIKAEAEENGYSHAVAESAEQIRATKIRAEFDRINKARAEADAEMDKLCEATGLNTGTLDEWFSDEPEDEPEWVKAAEAALEAHLDDDPQEDE